MAVVTSAWTDLLYVILWVANGLVFFFASTLFSLCPCPSTIWGTVLFVIGLVLTAFIYFYFTFGILWQIAIGIVIFYVFLKLIIGFSTATANGGNCCTSGSCGGDCDNDCDDGCNCCGFSIARGNGGHCPPKQDPHCPSAPYYPPRHHGFVNPNGPNPVQY
jgi:hypothetical protein